MTIEVRVQPRAKRNAISGRVGNAWKLHITAPALEGRANDACVDFLARSMGIAKSRVRMLRGEKSRNKVFELENVSEAEFLRVAARESG